MISHAAFSACKRMLSIQWQALGFCGIFFASKYSVSELLLPDIECTRVCDYIAVNLEKMNV